MVTLIGLSGSLRRGSYNSAVLRAAAALMPADSELRIESIAAIPLYDGDVESASGVPEPVTRLKDAIAAADGLLFVAPEYNNSSGLAPSQCSDFMSGVESAAQSGLPHREEMIIGARCVSARSGCQRATMVVRLRAPLNRLPGSASITARLFAVRKPCRCNQSGWPSGESTCS
jgi:hypothetical protein